MRKLGIQSVAFSVGMMTILSAVVWFVPTDPSLPLSVVAAPSVNDGSAAVLGCGYLASIREGEMGIGTQVFQRLMLVRHRFQRLMLFETSFSAVDVG